MKVKANPIKTIMVYLGFYAIASIVLFFISTDFTRDSIFPPTLFQIIALVVFTLFTIGFIVYAITTSYYVFNKSHLVQVNGGKKLVYNYNSILYIDIEWSIKHKTLLFYTDKGHARYLAFDRNNVLFKTVVAKATKTISKDEYQRRFPKVKM